MAMPSKFLSALFVLSVLSTCIFEVSGAMAVAVEQYSAAGCAAANLKGAGSFKALTSCFGTVAQKWSCSGSVATLHTFSDTSCQTELTAKKTVYSSACVADQGMWSKYHCVDLALLGTVSMYNAAGCPSANLTSAGIFSGASCYKKAKWDTTAKTWKSNSESLVISADKTELTPTKYNTSLDCTGTVTETPKTYTCGVCMLSPDSNDTWLVVNFPGCGGGLASTAQFNTPWSAVIMALCALAVAAFSM